MVKCVKTSRTKMMNKCTENYIDISRNIQICYLGGELSQRNLNGKIIKDQVHK